MKEPMEENLIPTCPFVLHISNHNKLSSWVVKTFTNEHTCLNTRNVKLCTVSWIAKEAEQIVASNYNIPVKALQDQFQRKYQIQLSETKVFRARAMARQKIDGNFTTQYALLRDYCKELVRANPGTSVEIEVEKEFNPSNLTRQFKRVYICLAPLREGFKACGRDLLGLDGCFMKGPFPGQILTAVGVDSNNCIYPVAYALVEAETTESWTWFLECLGRDFDLYANSNFTFISD
ncbi:uncharacterized protein LOC143596788 [Bidens hawaiensis]|uniref:uncharacterized protein LOC143596788 n=1 Tax=Bidens hawaiensis TaxID=980011 RepID=UPI00404A21D5